jgi:uncharacterized damage-inducible protein DinB
MKRFAFLTLVVIAFTSISAYAQITPAQLVQEWQRAKAYTKTYLDAMPDGGYSFKPTPEIRSFAGQMLHLADANYVFAATVAGKPNPLGKTSLEKATDQSKAATTKAVMDSYDFVIGVIQGMTPAQLNQEVKFAGKTLSKELVLFKAFEHQTHHRGQTTIYLRLKGVTPPPDMLF